MVAKLKLAFDIIVGVITVITGIKNFRLAKELAGKGQDILATKQAEGGKIPIIYGRRRVGSTLLYMDTDAGNSKELFVIYGLCLGEVESIELDTIEINGVPLSDTKVFRDGYYTGSDKITSGAGSLNTADQIGTSSGSFRGDGRSGSDPTAIYRMVFNAHHGADDQTVDPMLNASQPAKFTSNHKLKGIAYLACSFQYDDKGMFTSVPEVTVVVKGRKLYDPRLDGSITGGTGSHRIADKTTYEWSNNAALCLLDYMHADHGKGLASSLIDLQSFQTAANTADTVVDVPDYGGSYASSDFTAIASDNFISVPEATWKKIKGGELISVKDSGGSVIINQKPVVDVQRFKPHTEDTQYRINIGENPPEKVSKSVTFSATNGDATITVSCTSHGATISDPNNPPRVLFAGAVSLGGNITADVLNNLYEIATVVDANTFTIEAKSLVGANVLANASDTGNGGGSAIGNFMYEDESGEVLTQTRRFMCDGLVDTNETVLDNARDLLSNMRGFLNYVDGKYSVLIEDTGSSTFSITEDHIIDSGIKIKYEDKANKLNKAVAQFFNAQKKFEADTRTVLQNDNTTTFANDDGGEVLETVIELPFVTNPYNAHNMAKAAILRSRNQKTISFVGTPRLLNLTCGDIVDITYSPYNLSSAVYRVEAMDLLDNGLVSIQMLEYIDIYSWEASPPEENVGGEPDLPTGTEAEPPTNLSFTDATSSRRAFLTWTAATNYPAKEFRVIIKNSSGQEIHNRIVSDVFIDLDFIAVANGYVASITSISSTGAESSATSIAFNVTQQPVKLGDIQANAITATEIQTGTLTSASGVFGAISADDITTGTLDAANVTVSGGDVTINNSGITINGSSSSINLGSGAFTVSSAGALTATNATVTGNITASSLNVTGATITGTIDASKILLNGDPLTDIFALAGSGTAQTLSLGPDNKNLLKVDGVQIKYFAFDQVQNQGTEVLQMDMDTLELFNTRFDHTQITFTSSGSIAANTLSATTSLTLGSGSAPSTTTNKLYNVSGSLFFNGTQLGTGTGDITAVVAGTNLNGGGTSGSVTLNLDSTITGNHTFSNNLTVGGDLTVQGTTTTLNTATLNVEDKNITLNYSTGDSSGSANGAGITIQDAVNSTTDATILWDTTNDEFDFSHGVTLPDDEKLQFGASNDLQIFHQTSNGNSIIKESGGGILSIQTNGADVSIFDIANSQYMARFITGADVRLFHNGSVKLATTSTGVDVTGTLDASSQVLVGTNDSIFAENNIRFKSSGSAFIDHNTTGQDINFRVSNSSSLDTTALSINSSGNATFAGTISSGDIIISDSATPSLILSDTGNAGGGGASGKVIFKNTAGDAMGIGYTANVQADSDMIISTNAGGTYGGYLGLDANGIGDAQADIILEPKTNVRIATGSIEMGTTVFIDQSRNLTNIGTISCGAITTTGNINLGDNDKAVFGAGSDLQIYHDGNDSIISDEGTGGIKIFTAGVATSGFYKVGGEELATFEPDGAVTLYHNDIVRLATTSSGIDVSGAITSSGDILGAGVYVGSANTSFDFYNNGTSYLNGSTTVDDALNLTGSNRALKIAGTTVIDSSRNLTSIQRINTADGINDAGSGGSESVFNNNGTTADFRVESTSNTHMLFVDGGLNKVLIGTTSTTPAFSTGNGHAFHIGDASHISRSGGTTLIVNRGASDGNIVDLRKDGTSVGSIGTQNGQLFIGNENGSTDTGLLFGESGTTARAIIPATADGSVVDAALDLGYSSGRFKDLHLSGTISSGAITSTGTSTFGVITSASYKVGASTVIDNSRNLLNIGTVTTSGKVTVGNAVITGRDMLIIKTQNNNADRGLSFMNSGGALSNSIFAEDVGGNDARLVFTGGNASGTIGNLSRDFMINNQSGGGGVSGDIHARGDVVAFSSTISSDAKLKYDIQDIDDPISIIKTLRGRHFKWKKNDLQSSGVIAQEVEQSAMSFLVADKIDIENPDETVKRVKYDGFIGLLIEAIKEQQKQIEELKAKLDDCA